MQCSECSNDRCLIISETFPIKRSKRRRGWLKRFLTRGGGPMKTTHYWMCSECGHIWKV